MVKEADAYLDVFIKKYCEHNIFDSVSAYVERHFDEMDLEYSSDIIDNPENARLIGIEYKFPTDIKVFGTSVKFKAVYDCEIEIEQTIKREREEDSVNQWVSVC